MRRWEYVEGTASKFWETEAEGAVVTVRYGRCGSEGRTQAKEYASAEAAAAQVVKTIAEKEKKGYREVGASASTPAAPDTTAVTGTAPAAAATAPDAVVNDSATVLPDEDTFTLPDNWKRVLHPRRGGVRRGLTKAKRETFEAIDTRLAEEAAWIAEFADSPRSDTAAAEALRAHLDGDPSPAGAAALTAITDASGWADYWSERYGLPFAARAATEVFSVDADWQQSGLTRSAPRLRALPGPRHQYWAWHHRSPIDRVRALLAAADEATYRAAVKALAECRTDTLRRIIVSYLVPSETGWVDELCADPAVHAEQDRTLRAMVFSSLYSADQMALLPYRPDYTLGVATIATVAEGVGPAIAPALADTLDGTHYYSDSVKLAHAAPWWSCRRTMPSSACWRTRTPSTSAPRSSKPCAGIRYGRCGCSPPRRAAVRQRRPGPCNCSGPMSVPTAKWCPWRSATSAPRSWRSSSRCSTRWIWSPTHRWTPCPPC